MTRTPASVSRMTWLIRSSLTWVAWKSGMARDMTSAMKPTMSGRTTTSRPDSGTSWRRAMMIPPTIRIGAEMIRVRPMNTNVCTCWTSFVLRVMSEGAPNLLTSTWLNVWTVRKMALRTSRPKPIAIWAPQYTPRIAVDAEGERDDEHQPADSQDVVGVALRDALVDDVAVERRQVQVADRLQEQQREDEHDPAPVGHAGSCEAAGSLRDRLAGARSLGPLDDGLDLVDPSLLRPLDHRLDLGHVGLADDVGARGPQRPMAREQAAQLVVGQAAQERRRGLRAGARRCRRRAGGCPRRDGRGSRAGPRRHAGARPGRAPPCGR